MDKYDVAFTIYAVLGLVGLVLLTLLLPLVFLPSTVSRIPSRDFGVFHASVVLATLIKSIFVAIEVAISKSTAPYKVGLLCDIDASVTTVFTMVIVCHFPLLAINTHFKVTTRDNPPDKLFSITCSLAWCFAIYLLSGLILVGVLVTWGTDPQVPLGAWVGQHCVTTVGDWWRWARIITLFVPLALTTIISIPCALSVTLRHHLFVRRDVRALRFEVGILCFTAAFIMAFLVATWVVTQGPWPRPLEGALGIFVFCMCLNQSVIRRYTQWAASLLRITPKYKDTIDEESSARAFAASVPTLTVTPADTDPNAPIMYLAPKRSSAPPLRSFVTLGRKKPNKILAPGEMKEFIARIRPMSVYSSAPRQDEAGTAPLPTEEKGEPETAAEFLATGPSPTKPTSPKAPRDRPTPFKQMPTVSEERT